MGYIFGGMIIVSVLFSFGGGSPEAVAQAALSGAENAVKLSFDLLGMMCFWSGLLEVARRAQLTEKLSRLIAPVTKFLFPRLPSDSPAVSAMIMNITANVLGLSNAATPLGLAAMTELQKLNPKKERASDEMCMFVVLNTASISLLPTTVITMRAAAGSSDPFSIIVPVWLCSALALTVGVLMAKLLSARERRRL